MNNQNDLITVEIIPMDMKVVMPLEAANLVLAAPSKGLLCSNLESRNNKVYALMYRKPNSTGAIGGNSTVR